MESKDSEESQLCGPASVPPKKIPPLPGARAGQRACTRRRRKSPSGEGSQGPWQSDTRGEAQGNGVVSTEASSKDFPFPFPAESWFCFVVPDGVPWPQRS